MSKIKERREAGFERGTFRDVKSMPPIGKENFGYADQSGVAVIATNDNSSVSLKRYTTDLAYNNDSGNASSEEQPKRKAPSGLSQEPCNTSGATNGLERNLGFSGALSLIVGCMIGSGIFASGSTVALRSGSSGMILCVWSGCGLLATLGALCYAELGTAIPKSGSEHSYLTYAFGDLGGFMYTWVSILVIKPSAQAGICLAFGAYVVEALGGASVCGTEKSHMIKLLAAFAIGRAQGLFEWIFE